MQPRPTERLVVPYGPTFTEAPRKHASKLRFWVNQLYAGLRNPGTMLRGVNVKIVDRAGGLGLAGPTHQRSFWKMLRTMPPGVAVADGPAAGLAIVEALTSEPSLASYHLLPAVRADFLRKLGRPDEAREELARAASLARNARERELLLERARATPL